MPRRVIALLPLVVLFGTGPAGISLADGPPFVANLPQGTVELLGITYYQPTNQSRYWNRVKWWQPDGSAVQLDSLRPEGTHELRLFADKKTLTFLVRVELWAGSSRPSEHQSVEPRSEHQSTESRSYERSRYGDSASDASWPAWDMGAAPHWLHPLPMRWQGHQVADVRGNTIPDLRMFSAHFDPDVPTVDFRIGVSTSARDWETVIVREPDRAGRSSFHRDDREWRVQFSRATQGRPAGLTHVNLSLVHDEFYGRWYTRLVAVTADGREEASSIGYSGDNGTATFRNLPLSAIQEIRFQVRPYDWVEFRNISLAPGQKTHVTVVSSDKSAKAED